MSSGEQNLHVESFVDVTQDLMGSTPTRGGQAIYLMKIEIIG